MAKNFKILFIVLSAALLLPLLFFPLSSDSIVFMNIARKILEGKTLYLETIDLKPPLIYFIYIPVYLVSSGSEFIVRIIDFLYQGFILWSAYYVIVKSTGNEKIAFINCALFALIYTSFGANFTFQSDTHINLIMIWMIYIIFNKKPMPWWNLVLGAMTGILFFFKYNLSIIILPSILLSWYFQEGDKQIGGIFKTGLFQAAGMAGVICTVSLVFLDKAVWDGFKNVFEYSLFYSSMPAIDSNLFKYLIKEGSSVFADNFSILYIILVLIPVFSLLRNQPENDRERKFLQVSAVLGIVLLITVFIEKKLHIYHFTRFLIIATIFASFGAKEFYELIGGSFRKLNIPSKFISISFLALLAVYSPASRWLFNLRMPYYYITNTAKYDELFERAGESANTRVQMKSVVGYIKTNASASDTVITISTGANLINLLLADYNTSAFEQSCFYLGTLKIPEWQQMINTELKNAEWLIIQNNDRHPWIYGHNLSSWEAINKDTAFKTSLNNFHTVLNTENFFVMKRN